MTENPTLSARELHDREAQIGMLLADALINQRELPDGLRTRFRDDPGIEDRVRELVAAAHSCRSTSGAPTAPCGWTSSAHLRRNW